MSDSPQCADFWSPKPRRGAVIAYDPNATIHSSSVVRWVGGYFVQIFEEATEFSSPCRKGPPSTLFLCRRAAEMWARDNGATELIYR
jgi:hypothetical protein